VASPARTGLDGPSLAILRVGLTFAFATASFYLVEQPIRRGALKGRWALAVSPSAFVATGAVVIIATAGAAPLPTYLQNGPQQLTSRAEQLPKPETQPAPPPTAAFAAPAGVPTAPPPNRIMLVGDSVAESLLDGLQEAATEQGVQLYPASVPGCGILGGQPIDLAGTPFKWSATCEREVPKYQTARLAQIHPDVVIWLSEWDRDDRIVDGQSVTTTTMTGRFVFARLIDEAATRLTSTGARLVMMTVAPPSPSDSSPDPPKDPKFDYMNRMLRDYARTHADHTSVVDLARLLCPNSTQPCPEEVSGIRPRPRDGNHFEPDTAVWVAHQLMPQIMAATPGYGIDVAAPAATTNASVGKRA
jgi:hypothetical protein